MWMFPKHLRKGTLSHAQLEALVLQRTAALQNLSQRLLSAQDEERRRVARDLHDSTGQTLSALKVSVAILQTKLDQGQSTVGVLADIAVLADQALQEIRTMSYLLHPPLLDEVGFNSAASWFVDGFAKRSGIKVALDLATERERLPMTIEIALFRVLQEGLTNVHRHSGALEVSICLYRQAERVMLEMRDSGRGIPVELLNRLRAASSETGVGLAGMRERLNQLNGKLEIDSDGHGTSLRVIVPLPAIARPVHHKDCEHIALSAHVTTPITHFQEKRIGSRTRTVDNTFQSDPRSPLNANEG